MNQLRGHHGSGRAQRWLAAACLLERYAEWASFQFARRHKRFGEFAMQDPGIKFSYCSCIWSEVCWNVNLGRARLRFSRVNELRTLLDAIYVLGSFGKTKPVHDLMSNKTGIMNNNKNWINPIMIAPILCARLFMA